MTDVGEQELNPFQPLRVSCDVCGATIGETCRNTQHPGWIHAGRVLGAIMTPRPPMQLPDAGKPPKYRIG